MDTIVLHIELLPLQPWREILISWLSEQGCNAFEETKEGLTAYGQADELDEKTIESKIRDWAKEKDIQLNVRVEVVPHKNWNALWEADFQPVEVEHYLTILAPFHEKKDRKGMIIEIQPQMSFGTGHHQTTWMMSKALFEYGDLPERVLDMGTGTGILAIASEKLGAQEIVAIDIEEWSAENTRENAVRNACEKIKTFHGDIDLIENQKFGLILANINKNVLKAQFQMYDQSLDEDGRIVISGFFETDVDDMTSFARNFNFEVEKQWNKETWAALQLKRKET